MNRRLLASACSIALIALVLNFQSALAHESITVGDYEIVYGWVNEPPVAGQLNGVEIFVNNMSSGEPQPVEDISSLVVELSYGGEIRTLTMDGVFDSPGAFASTVLPTIPGLYSVNFTGTLGDTPVDAEVELEEVVAADTVQFPRGASTEPATQDTSSGTANWLVWLSLLLGLSGVGLGAMALRKAR